MPSLTRMNSLFPKLSLIDFTPLLPASPPLSRILICPKSKSRSSWMMITLFVSIRKNFFNLTTASPLKFIKVWGFERTTFWSLQLPLPHVAIILFLSRGMDNSFESWSITRNPMLWRVNLNFRPGLPRPTINHTELICFKNFYQDSVSLVLSSFSAAASPSSTTSSTTFSTSNFGLKTVTTVCSPEERTSMPSGTAISLT